MRVSMRPRPDATWVRTALRITLIQVLGASPASGQTLDAPANLRAATLTANRVDLAWEDRSAGEDGFRIERALDVNGAAGSFAEIATLPANGTTYADKGIAAAATYWYRLRAYRGSEYGPYSDAVSVTPCIGAVWQNLDTGGPTPAGLGLREPPVPVIYGWDRRNGAVVWPGCAVFGGPVRVPVLMIDWQDFDPRVNASNENNPTSTFPEYVPSTPGELQAFLQSSVSPYYSDVSGGRATVSFDVVGWIRSGPGSYLKPRSQYLYNLHDLNPTYPDPTWQCRGTDIFLDALKDAVVQAGVDLSRYDLDGNGLLDGAVLVYEGKGGLCGGGNLSWVNSSYSTNPPAFQWLAARELVPPSDPNWPAFNAQPGWIHLFNNMPERLGDSANSFYYSATWVHELGHLLFGYSDYYYSRFNIGSWALSGNHGAVPTHPAAFEKWLFGRWIDPTVITTPGQYTVTANEIPDGGAHSGGPYLYRIPIDGDPNRFLTIEGRWFDADGNTGTRWAQANLRESGLLIVEFNLAQDWYSTSPQLYRHVPDRASGAPTAQLRAFRPGDRFSRCYSTSCITIEPTSAPGATFSFSVGFGANRSPVANVGGPYSGVANQAVAFNASGSSDPDGDPITYQWTFGDGATGSGVNPTHAYTTAGSYTATLVVSDGVATSTPSTTDVTVVSPVITVTTPNTSVNWLVGSAQTIAWTHNLGTGSTVDIDVTRDGGATWSAIASSVTNASATAGSYAWLVTNPATTSARIRVRTASGAVSDVGDADFTIARPNQAPVANVGGPYSGVVNQTVTFNASGSSDPDGDPITYQWTLGDGTIGAGVNPTHAYTAAGNYTATLVVSDGVATSTLSSTTVAIVSSVITVTAPNTNVSWLVGSAQTIAWTHNLGTGSTVDVDVSRDGGATWSAIASSVTNASATAGSYAWSVTNPTTTSARIRVRTASGAVSDVDDADFTIAKPNQVPVANVGGPYSGVANQAVAFSASGSSDPDGDPITCQWTFGDGATGSGVSPTHAYTAAGNYTATLVVNDGIATSTPSTTTVTIVSSVITVTAPNTGVNWGVGSTQTIVWTHNLGNGSTVNIDVSRDGGATWKSIASSIANTSATTGSYAWVVSGAKTTSARIRVRTASGAVTDASDVNFTIAAAFVTVTSPNSAVRWTIGSTQAITWTHNLGTAQAVKIEVSRDSGTTWSVISGSTLNSGESTGSYNWTVSGPSTTRARIRLTWTANSAVNDRSNVNFTIQ